MTPGAMKSGHAGETHGQTMPWREVAWSDIRFSVPAHWTVWEIEKRYLLLGDAAGPVFEVKWNQIRGHFAHGPVLRRLAAMHPEKGRCRLQTVALPEPWAAVLGDFKAGGFSWTVDSGGGTGALLYHPCWQTAVMVQFFHRPNDPFPDISPRVLASFRWNREDGKSLWSVFDLRAEIPETFVLKGHRFDAGAFELVFTGPMGRLCLYRKGPARLLLAHQDLAQFGLALEGFARGRLIAGSAGALERVDWAAGADAGPARRLWQRMTSAWPCARSRLWVPSGHNQILGVRLEGRSPVSEDVMEAICSGYGLVS